MNAASNTPFDAQATRLIVASNRLPFILHHDEANREWTLQPGSGGLVSALVPVLRNRGGMWIGWPGTTEAVPNLRHILAEATRDAGYDLTPIPLTQQEHDLFYYGFSNEIVWPLFHDLPSLGNFDPNYWQVYETVNDRFAQAIRQHATPADFVWVHDYHLLDVAHRLRESHYDGTVSFFLHIPFPPLDIFLKIPHRTRLLNAMLDYDLLGFQTSRDRRNFVQCVRTLLPGLRMETRGSLQMVRRDGRETDLGVFPIGIDYEGFERDAAKDSVSGRAWTLHEDLPNRQLILGVDRLDYTKGIPQRIEAFRHALLVHPELKRRVTFVQVVVPSRQDIPRYNDLKTQIERLVGEVNGQFTSSGWVPIHYIYRSLSYDELLAYYRTSEIALITPLKDGMNLVCKEYCACNLEGNGTLILSEFAGAAAQLQRGALLVNPYDVEDVADAIHRAYHMDAGERRVRMRRLRRAVKSQDIFWWVDAFMRAAIDKELEDFPVLEASYAHREESGLGGV